MNLNVDTWKKQITNVSASPLRPGTLSVQGISRITDQVLGDQPWVPFVVRSLLRVGRMGVVDANAWSFMAEIKKLDAKTPENLEKKYAAELAHWRNRFQELSFSMRSSVYMAYSGVLRPLSVISALFGIGGAVGLVYAFRLHWAWGIPIYVGFAALSGLLGWGALTALSFIKGARKGRGYADVLLVNSLSQVLRDVFEYNLKSRVDEVELKTRIVRGIEESAKWLQRLPLKLPSKDRALKDWYRAQMQRAASKLLDLRQYVIMSRAGYNEELKEKLMVYFNAALRQEYGNLLDEEVIPHSKTALGKAKRIVGWTLTLGSIAGFVVLLVIDVFAGESLQLIEAIRGTGIFAAVASILQVMFGTRGLAETRVGIDVFNQIVSNTKEIR